ncbi:three component ABC system middle component [Pseudomonas bharatica]|uniref:three component ABC system middle component n=1 Tax=Pseudomonas bharatica TaxID=2692112 RepID=UPI003B287F98
MSEPYVDRELIHNSSLACFLMTHFVKEYEDVGSPFTLDLPKLMVVLPLAWNEGNREKLNAGNTRPSLENILRKHPALRVDLEKRVRAHLPTTLQGLNLAVASRLVGKMGSPTGEKFQLLMERWPRGIKNTIPVSMLLTVERLAKWFSTLSTEDLYKLLFGIPHEVHH